MWYTDSELEFREEIFPRTVHACNLMKVEGEDIGADDIAAGMFPAEETDDEEVMRLTRHVRNVLDSNSDGEPATDDDGGAEAGAVQPPGTMVVFEELAPGDAINPCQFPLHW